MNIKFEEIPALWGGRMIIKGTAITPFTKKSASHSVILTQEEYENPNNRKIAYSFIKAEIKFFYTKDY